MPKKKILIDWESQENIEWQDYAAEERADLSARRHLVVTTDNFLPRWDGISRFLSEILPRLKNRYDITVVSPDYGACDIPGIEVVQIPLMKRAFGDYTPPQFAFGTLRHIVRKADLVFNQSLGPIGVSAILAARSMKRPIASYIHSVEWELVPKALARAQLRGPLVAGTKTIVRLLYNQCTMLIVPSENIAEQFSWQRIRTQKRVAHLGVDTAKFTPIASSKERREQLGLPKDAFIIGFHGRIAHEKNLLTLLRGFKRFAHPKKHLLIVGDGVAEIRSRLSRHKDVTVAGIQDNVVPWLQAMDVYVMPSFTETTSLAVLEAMACGLPVVSSKVGFIKYYIIDEQNGMFFDHHNGFDLARKLSRISKDPDLQNRMGQNARRTIEKSFRWEHTAESIRKALDEI